MLLRDNWFVVQKWRLAFMYVTQEIATRIKQQARLRKIAIKDLLSDCELSINAISEFSKGKQMSCISLARIADHLG